MSDAALLEELRKIDGKSSACGTRIRSSRWTFATAIRDLHLRRRGVVCLSEDRRRAQLGYGGFERDRNTLKYRCPARALGIECKGMEQCPVGAAVRIPLSEDRRGGGTLRYAGRIITTSAAPWSGSTAAWLARSGSTTRSSVGWPRCGCAARAL